MRRAIVSAFPELADAAFAVAGRGWHSLAVEVDGRLVFKFPEGEEADAALRREARLLGRVAPHLVLPVPRMTLHEGPPLFSRHEKLQGETLLREGYLRLGEAARDRLADDLAGFFAQLHALEPAAMQAAGALPVGLWDTRDETLASVWEVLPPSCRAQARAALDAWRTLGPDPLGERYGFFDAHGWNMAFDADRGVLNGIFDFADSGLGPIHREFVPVSLIEPDLTARTIHAYERLTGHEIDCRRIFLQTAAMRLSELAGEIGTGGRVGWTRELVLDWFSQQAIR